MEHRASRRKDRDLCRVLEPFTKGGLLVCTDLAELEARRKHRRREVSVGAFCAGDPALRHPDWGLANVYVP